MPDTTRPCGGCQPPSSARRRHKRYAPHKPSQPNSPRGLSQANRGHGPPSSFGLWDVGRSISVRMPIDGNGQVPEVNQLRHAGRQAGFHQVLDLQWHTATCSRKESGQNQHRAQLKPRYRPCDLRCIRTELAGLVLQDHEWG